MATNPAASITIDAPLSHVWAIMLDTEAYADWNPFITRAECVSPPEVGAPIVLHVQWADGKTNRSAERISIIDAPRTDEYGATTATLAYVYRGLPSKLGLVRGTRYQRLRQEHGGPTLYDTVEEFRGPLVKFAGPGRVADGFRRHAKALKQRAESS